MNTVARVQPVAASMKVPPKRKGNDTAAVLGDPGRAPSMKVPPKRKGNATNPPLSWEFLGPQ